MIPLHDDNPTAIRPVVTWGLIGGCVLVYLWQFSLTGGAGQEAVYGLGLIPAVLFGERALPPDVEMVPAFATLFTSMFMHGGLLHVSGNMLYLWIFGNNVEDAMGHGRFAAFYVVCGLAAALAHALYDPASTVPMVGASGAIGGVLGAYLLLHPKARILVLIPVFIFPYFVRVPAAFVLGLWFVLQIVNTTLFSDSGGGGVAYLAHIGGFVAGALLILVMRKQGVLLFDRGRLEAIAAHQVPRLPWVERRYPVRVRPSAEKDRGPKTRGPHGPWDPRSGPWG
jgi:membrane associated rhomboid family serine protease